MNLKSIRGSSLQFLVHDSVINGCPSIPLTLHQFFNRLTPNSHINISQDLISKAYNEKIYRHLKQQYFQSRKKELGGIPLFTPYLTTARFKDLVTDIYSPFVPQIANHRLFSSNSKSLFTYLVKYYNHCAQQGFRQNELQKIFQLMRNYSGLVSIGVLMNAEWLNFNIDMADIQYTYLFDLKKPESLNLSHFQDYRSFENIYSLEYQCKMNNLLISEFCNTLMKNRSVKETKYIITGESCRNLQIPGYKHIQILNGKSNVDDLLAKYILSLDNFEIQLSTLLDIYQSISLKDVIRVNSLEELFLLLKVLTSMMKAN
ncbi:unnamed protein product [Debaryomyces fabryi]|nr:unnamed protein product [Debaryomyces fabryi]